MLICLTGTPGIGKTTIIKKLIEHLRGQNLKLEGFFTEEVRNGQGNREGFDIVTVNNGRGVLSRKSGVHSSFKVGSYCVDINQFESLAIPLLNNPQKLMVIDEIGKMELCSEKFKGAMESLLNYPDITIIATVPLKSNDIFINNLKKNCKKLIHVNQANRNNILDELNKLL